MLFRSSCTDSRRTGRYVRGPELVAQACYRRLTTPRGTLRGGADEANYGLDLVGLVGTITTPAHVAALPGRIQNELRKDERVADVAADVVATQSGPGTVYTVTIRGTTADGPFRLVLAVSSVTVELVGLGGAA